ncbi:MAG: metallophosphoesterase family protein [Myxococcota bacterium]
MARLFILTVGAVLTSCVGVGAPEAKVTGRESQSTALPAPWTDTSRASARARLAESVSAEALSRALPPPSLAYRRSDRNEVSYSTFASNLGVNAEIAVGPSERIEIHDLVTAEPPRVSLEGTTLTVRFTTLMPIQSAKLYIGTLVPGGRFRKPVFRGRANYELFTPQTEHEIRYNVAWLLSPKYDVQDVARRGRGHFAFRLEVQVPPHLRSGQRHPGRVYVEDGRVAFRCSTSPCEDLLQLPTIGLGPMVDLVTATSATVSWLTDVPTLGRVIVRHADGRERAFDSAEASARHEVALAGLEPDTAYRYLVVACDVRGECVDEPAGTLVTPAPAASRMRFAVMSDSRASIGTPMTAYRGVNRQVVEELFIVATQEQIDFAVFAGDLITGYVTQESAYRRQLLAWQEATEPFAMHLPIYEGIGNHEMLGDAWSTGWLAGRNEGETSETVFAELMVNPKNGPSAQAGEPSLAETVFSFDRGVVHFAALNSNYFYRNKLDRDDHPAADRGGYREGWLTQGQLDWLDADLARARAGGARHLFVFTHEPAFPNGGHVQDAMWYRGTIPEVLERRDAFMKILMKHGVLALFSGDEHNYSRTRIDQDVNPGYAGRLWQIITGGAGAPYYAQDVGVPWVENVESFAPVHHTVLVDVDGDRVRLRAVTTQGETVDSVELTAAPLNEE